MAWLQREKRNPYQESLRAYTLPAHTLREINVRPRLGHGAQLAQRIAVLDNNEMPGLTVHAAPRQSPCLNDSPDEVRRDSFILITSYGQHRTHRFKDFHRLSPSVQSKIIWLLCSQMKVVHCYNLSGITGSPPMR